MSVQVNAVDANPTEIRYRVRREEREVSVPVSCRTECDCTTTVVDGDVTDGNIVVSTPTEGYYKLCVCAKDAVNFKPLGLEVGWVVDHTAPTIEMASEISGFNTTNKTVLEFAITAIDVFNASLEYRNKDEDWTSLESSSEANVTSVARDGALFTVSSRAVHAISDLTDGQHWVQFRATDIAGHQQESSRQYWTVDTVAPNLELVTGPPQLPEKYSSVSAQFSLTILDNFASWRDCVLLISVGTVGASMLEQELGIVVGDVTSTAEAVQIRVASVSDIAGVGTEATVSLDITGLRIQCPASDCTWTGASCNHDCEYEIRVRSKDSIGNEALTASSYRWTVDTILPIATVEITEGPSPGTELVKLDKWGDAIEPDLLNPVTRSEYFNINIECGDFLKNEALVKDDACSETESNTTGFRVDEDCAVMNYTFSDELICATANCPDTGVNTAIGLSLRVDNVKWNMLDREDGSSFELFFELTVEDRAHNTYTRRYKWDRKEDFVAHILWGPGGSPGEFNSASNEVDNSKVITMPQELGCDTRTGEKANQPCEDKAFELCLFAPTNDGTSLTFELSKHDDYLSVDVEEQGWRLVPGITFEQVLQSSTAQNRHPCANLLESEYFNLEDREVPEACETLPGQTALYSCDPELRTVLDSISDAKASGDFSNVSGTFGGYNFTEQVTCPSGEEPGVEPCDGKVVVRVKGFGLENPTKWKWKMQDRCPTGQYPDVQDHKVLMCRDLPTSKMAAATTSRVEVEPMGYDKDSGFVVNEGWWADLRNGRVIDESTTFQQCPFDSCRSVAFPICNDGSCVDQWTLASTEHDDLCKDMYTGPVCALCVEGYYIANGVCLRCEAGNKGNFYLLLVAMVLVFIAGARIYWMFDAFREHKLLDAEAARKRKGVGKLYETPNSSNWRVVKQLLEFVQILAILSETYAVPWPAQILNVTEWCRVFALDILELFGLSCFYPVNFYSKLLLVGLFPVFTVSGIFVVFKLVKTLHLFGTGELNHRKFARFRTICTNTMLFLLINLHPIVSIQLFQIFNCHAVEVQDIPADAAAASSASTPTQAPTMSTASFLDLSTRLEATGGLGTADGGVGGITEKYYLRSDYNVECYDSVWYGYLGFTAVIAMLYTAGLPLGLYLYLRSKRGRLYHPHMLQRVGMLYEDYSRRRGMWWWETEELCRRFMLSSLLVAFRNVEPTTGGSVGSILQSGLACAISIIAHVAHTYYRPFERPLLAGVQHACLFALWAIFLGGLMFSALEGLGKNFGNSETYQFVTVVVLASLFFVFFGTATTMFWIMARPKTKKAAKKTCPQCNGRGKVEDKLLLEQQEISRESEENIDFSSFLTSKAASLLGRSNTMSSSRSLGRMTESHDGARAISDAGANGLATGANVSKTLKHWKTHKMSAKMKSHATANLRRQHSGESMRGESMSGRPKHMKQADSLDEDIVFHEPVDKLSETENPMITGGGSGSSNKKAPTSSSGGRKGVPAAGLFGKKAMSTDGPIFDRQKSNPPFVEPTDGLDNRRQTSAEPFSMPNPMAGSVEKGSVGAANQQSKKAPVARAASSGARKKGGFRVSTIGGALHHDPDEEEEWKSSTGRETRTLSKTVSGHSLI
jgi:hypothetical protein